MQLLMIGAPEIIFIVLIVLLLFGGKKIPELMRGLGKGVRSFKEGMNDIEGEIKRPLDTPQQSQQAQPSSSQQPQQPSANQSQQSAADQQPQQPTAPHDEQPQQ